ncbi:glycosyltransferase family 4 protein [Bacteroides caecimuris]|uniref:Glycosyltransferase family 1 protein n=1 Tax=Bacteroides caecimuris TaxID=1796613 RepID=A0A4S2D841_9BACE|nr:glycosyltransferase family 1 protein [Bacteroides caecimuris]NDO61701.1 glycosyltransferase family 4 protein [Bacteroides caecimuris]TGY37878.1 glycosyltransferase family 1 protein [Bacteroides caecimuris]
MRIGFDGKRAVQNFTGLGNYSRYIVDILCQFYPENEYILYAPKKRENKRLNKLTNQYRQLQLAYPVTFWERKFRSLWRISGITHQLEKEKVSIYHGLSNELPLNIHKSNIKSIVTIHDLIFLRYPQYYHFIDRKIYTYKFRKACENADKIIAISECTKRDIISFFHIPSDKIEVVYQSCDPIFGQSVNNEKKEEVRSKYQLPPKYILNVGSIEERKNALLLVQTLPQLPQDIHLVIVGKRTPYTEKIERFASEHNLTPRVHIMHNVPFGDLPAIYQLAEIFAYPSYFEGFGIPIIEALHSGIPVVAATGSCLEEAGGPDSIYVNPDSVDEASRAFNEILSKPEKKKLMIEKGKEFIKQFSEEKQATQIINIYNNINNRYE